MSDTEKPKDNLTIKVPRKNNSKEYNRKNWHKMKLSRGKVTCEHCKKTIDQIGWSKHIKGQKHKTLESANKE
tara:strand:- start:229 stop:444 length:216 start_codon:yes stop_codon:yes gene_type:complete